MTEQEIDDLVETIMRTRYGKYEDYANEKEREYWRKYLTEDKNKNDTMVREQPGQ